VHGRVFVTGNGSVQEITKENKEYGSTLHLFINAGNQAHYLLGSPDTNDAHPNNATVKFGITESHQHFTPHAHGSEHYVKSEGFSGCLLYDHAKKKAFPVKLLPGSLIYIPEWVPHAFYNRSDIPLITLIANGGLGLKDENYAVTKKTAEERLKQMDSGDKDLEELASVLGSIEELFDATHPERHMDMGEKIASKLYRVAEYFSMH
jgi:mannose-6-phosphate isomerase-like protein (cupin superfamily)